jgi:hypothetical protein
MSIKGVGQPLVLAAVLAAGFAVVWGLLGLWAVEVAGHVAGLDPESEALVFLADGTPRLTRSAGRYGAQYCDLDGNPVPAPVGDHAGHLNGHRLAAAPRPAKGDVPWDERVRCFSDGHTPAVYWYFVSDGRADGTGYFVGYDSRSRALVGYLGTAGFRDASPAAEELFPFGGRTSGPHAAVLCTLHHHNPTGHPPDHLSGQAPRGSVSTWDVYVVGRDHKIYHAGLHNRTVHVALDEPRLRSAALAAGVNDPVRGTPYRLAARTDDAVMVLDERGGLLQRYPIPETLRGRDLTFAETTTGEALLYWKSPDDFLATEADYRIAWVAPDGRSREAAGTLRAGGGVPLQVFAGVMVPSPLVLGGYVVIGRPYDLCNEGLSATYPEALARALTEFWPALLIAQLVGAGLAVLCHRRQVRYGAGRAERVVWPLFVLLVGLPGWVGYRFGRSWPVRERCPACGVDVPRDRGACACCAADFPRPALRGTEVFA